MNLYPIQKIKTEKLNYTKWHPGSSLGRLYVSHHFLRSIEESFTLTLIHELH